MKFFRRNEKILARQVRVIDEEGEQAGVMPIEHALKLASEKGLDLIEISPKAVPPVCKIDDFGSFSFRMKKAEKKQKLASKKAPLKSIRYGIRISDNDLKVKINKAQKFLEKNHPVRIVLQFRGREATHADIGMQKMKIFIEELANVAKPESEPKRQGNRVQLMLRPEKSAKK